MEKRHLKQSITSTATLCDESSCEWYTAMVQTSVDDICPDCLEKLVAHLTTKSRLENVGLVHPDTARAEKDHGECHKEYCLVYLVEKCWHDACKEYEWKGFGITSVGPQCCKCIHTAAHMAEEDEPRRQHNVYCSS